MPCNCEKRERKDKKSDPCTCNETKKHRQSKCKCKCECKCKPYECTPPNRSEYDFIVVGSGAGAAFLIRNLVRSGRFRVLVLEAGFDPLQREGFTLEADPAFGGPFLNASGGNRFIDTVRSDTDQSIQGENLIGWSSKTKGGSTSINYLQSVRASPLYYQSLSQLVGPEWSYASLLPFMKEIEDYSGVPKPSRGENGPIHIFQPDVPQGSNYIQDFALAMQQAAFPADAGIPIAVDYNDGYNNVISYNNQMFAERLANGNLIRSFPTTEIYPQLFDSNGVSFDGKSRFLTNAEVEKIIWGIDKTARGVSVIFNDTEYLEFTATKRIILCAGTIRTPGILERSGYGDAAILETLGVPVVVNNPDVGENVKNHPISVSIVQVPADKNVFLGFTREGYFGPLGLNFNSDSSTNRTVETVGFPGTFGTFSGRATDANVLLDLPTLNSAGPYPLQLASFYLKTNPIGRVHVNSKSPQFPPVLQYTSFTGDDRQAIIDNMRYQKAFVDQAAANTGADYRMLYPPESAYVGPNSDDNLYTLASSTVVASSHWSGSCIMKAGEGGVVDPRMNVKQVKNLMICDASISPIIADANTTIPTYIYGLQAWKFISQDLGL